MAVLDNVEPQAVFRFFEEICSIPHGSSDTWKISNYLVQFAKDRNLRYIQDKLGNVIIYKPGTTGYESSPSVIIQGHMDMVCEKDNGCDIDFSIDGLRLRLNGNIIDAEGTTLGGDDGIAVAYALAILDAGGDTIPHPPIEVVITVDEEIGMLGAAGLDCTPLKSHIMLNLDSEDEGELLVSCAGGVTSVCRLPIEYSYEASDMFTLTVAGITGGHSGMEIIKQGANADKVMGRLLYELYQIIPFRLISVKGGLKDNAIPREATAELAIKRSGEKIEDDQSKALKTFVESFNSVLKSEYRNTDPNIYFVLEKHADNEVGSVRCMTEESTLKTITMLMCVPNGVQRMSEDIKGLVQTSLNIGILRTEAYESDSDKREVVFSFSVRSGIESEKRALTSSLKCMVEGLGGSYTESGAYPAWEYKKDSELRDLMVEIYEEMYGVKPKVQAIHAGVECGLFAGNIPNLDCVSYGPQMDDIHTTSERLYVDSVKRTWDYTLKILERLK